MTEEKRSRGRPKKTEADKGRKLTIYLTKDIDEWLQAQPGGISKAIAQLVRAAKGE